MRVILTSALRTGTHWLIEILSDLLEVKWTFHSRLKDARNNTGFKLVQVHNIAPETLVKYFDKVIAITRCAKAVLRSRKKFDLKRGFDTPDYVILNKLRIYETDFKHEKYLTIKYRHLQQMPFIMMRRIADFLGTMHSDRELYDIWEQNRMGGFKWKTKMFLPENVHGAELL